MSSNNIKICIQQGTGAIISNYAGLQVPLSITTNYAGLQVALSITNICWQL